MRETPNLSYIEKISSGNKQFVKKLLGIIKKELSDEINTYKLNLKLKDLSESAANVHKLNHKIRLLGLEQGGILAETYRMNLLENNLKLKSDFERILTNMLLYIEKVKL